jgi:triacylglycerol lipase
MIARVLRVLFVAWFAALAALVGLGRHQGWTPGVWAGLAVLLFGHPTLLALELALARALAPPSTTPGPRWGELLRAWLGEWRASTLTFGWQMPWRAGAIEDHLPRSSRGLRGVVFIHGYICNRGFWNPWLARLRKLDRAFVAVSLEPVFGGIDEHCDAIERAVRRVEASTGLAPVIVAHSMGGLVARAWLRARVQRMRRDGQHEAARIITIGSPHRGTWLARVSMSANGRQMRPDGDWLEALAAGEPPALGSLFTCWWSECDQIVHPAPTAVLPGSEAHQIRGVGHVALAGREEIWKELRWRIDY